MKAKIIHVLCEGQTEQGFVDEVLKPYFKEQGITAVKSVIVTTNKKKNARGGMLTYLHAKNDLDLMLRSHPDGEYERHLFTTMFDFYALPNDFPGYAAAQKISDQYKCVEALELAHAKAVASERFVPYIQLHEFEALVFCGIDYLPDLYPGCEKRCNALKAALQQANDNPEEVNNNVNTAPNKRIIKAIEGDTQKHYNYNKPKTGKYVTKKVGIDNLRVRCRHFNDWIEKLITL